MVLVNRNLWFDNCVADTIMLYVFVLLFFGSLFLVLKVVEWRKPLNPSQKGQLIGVKYVVAGWPIILLVILIVYSSQQSLADVVRIVVVENQVQVRRCIGVFENPKQYAAEDILFQYERDERGTRKIVHHCL
jgi:hypothetical protein